MRLVINPAILANTLHILLHTGTSKDPAYKYRLFSQDYIQKILEKPKPMQNHFNSSKLLGRTEALDSRTKLTSFGSPGALPSIKSPHAKDSPTTNQLPSFSSDPMLGGPNNRYKEEGMKLSRPFLGSINKTLKTEGNPENARSNSKQKLTIKKTSARTEST
jgi:hypothetical protein